MNLSTAENGHLACSTCNTKTRKLEWRAAVNLSTAENGHRRSFIQYSGRPLFPCPLSDFSCAIAKIWRGPVG